MSSPDPDRLVRRTLLFIAAFIFGSAAFIALLTFVLISTLGALLPRSPAGAPADSTQPALALAPTLPRAPAPAPTLTPAPEADVARTARPAPPRLEVCCLALAQNIRSAPPEQKALYLSATALCRQLVKSHGVDGFNEIHEALNGALLPASCK
jgi:hypothetical protein